MNNFLARADGFVYLLLAYLCTSTIAIAGKIGLQQDISPIQLLAVRMVLATAVLWVYFLCFKRDMLRIDRAGLIGCMQVATAGTGSMCCSFFALLYLDASLLIVVYVTALIPAVMLLLMIQGEFPSRLDLFRFVLGLIGVYLFVELVGEVSWFGILLIMIMALLVATYMTTIQLRLGDYDSETVTLYVVTFMAIQLSVLYLGLGYRSPQFETSTWAAALWLAIIATAIARFLLFAGIKKAGSSQAALLFPLNTLLGVLWAVLLLGESITLQQWVGTLLVVASAALGAKAKSDRARAKTTKTPEVQPNAT